MSVLDLGKKLQVLSMPAADAELLESLRVEVEVRPITADDICDWFGIERPVSFEPGHVMRWEKYRELEIQQQK
jgi:hypothetical protein